MARLKEMAALTLNNYNGRHRAGRMMVARYRHVCQYDETRPTPVRRAILKINMAITTSVGVMMARGFKLGCFVKY